MTRWKSVILLLTVFISKGFCRHLNPDIHEDKPLKQYPKINEKPLILTPYIENGNITKARQLAQVEPPLAGNVISYTGFFTVNKTYNSNLFFWFIPAEINSQSAPVAVWLQGGPGSSSLFGLFSENGPFEVNDNLTITLREYRWTKRVSMLYIDNPVGAGFSFTNKDDGYSRSQLEVTQNLHNFLQQFFLMFPALRKNDLFLIGSSYAVKYVSRLGTHIHQTNGHSSSPKINLKGVLIGSGLCDPAHMLNFGDLLYQIGLIDWRGKRFFDNEQEKVRALIRSGKLDEANDAVNVLIGSQFPDRPSNFTQITGFVDYFNFLEPDRPAYEPIPDFLVQPSVRRLIHVGDSPYNYSSWEVRKHLPSGDKMESDVLHLQTLIENNYKLLFFNGQLDIIRGYAAFLSFMENFAWSGAAEYRDATRRIWRLKAAEKETIAGYYKSVKGLTEVMVRNAGHNVASDQPLFAYHMITGFMFGEQFS